MCLKDNFCGLYSGRVGTVAAIVFNAVWIGAHFMLTVLFLTNALAIVDKKNPTLPDRDLLVDSILGCVFAVCTLLSTISLVLILVGTSKNLHPLIMAYLVIDVMQLILCITADIWSLTIPIYSTIAALTLVVGKVYLWFVVLAFYNELCVLTPSFIYGTALPL